jgi:hypothetical protein
MSQPQNFDNQSGQPQKKPISLSSIPPARPEDLTYQRFDGKPPKMRKIHICLAEPERTLVVVTQVEEEIFDRWAKRASKDGVYVIAPDQARFRYTEERIIGVGDDINSILAATVDNKPVFQPKGYSWCLID